MPRQSSAFACVLILLAAGGCGSSARVLRPSQAPPPGAVTRTFDAPVARVLFSAVGPGAFEPIVWSDQMFDFTFRPTSDAKALAEAPSPQALLTSPVDPSTYDLEAGGIGGKTRDGRSVNVWFDEQDDGKKCRVTVLIGRIGDPDLSLRFLDHLSSRLAAPTNTAQTRVAPPSG